MNLGPLNRSGQIFTNNQTAGLGGAVKNNEVFLRDVFLTQRPPSARTVLTGARDAEQTETVFMMRWFDGLRDGMVLKTEGHSYRIVRHDELGRREGWQVYGREIS